MLTSLFRKLFPGSAARRTPFRRVTPKSPCRLAVEMLEDRAVPTAVAAPSGMVAWWTADGNGVDLIGGNNASLYNGADFAAGKVSQAFNFDGVNDRAQVADTDALKLTGSMTIEAWVLAESIPTTSGIILFRGDDRGGLDPYQLHATSSGSVRFRIQSLTAAVSVEAALPRGVWTHVAATLDDATGSMNLYVNGSLAAQTITAVRPFGDLDAASNPSIGIGNHGGYPSSPHNFPFDGQIDELSVYNRALTSGEVQGIFSAGGAGKIKGGNYFAVDAPTVVEGPAGSTSVATFTIWRVGSLAGQATADWTTVNGTATAGSDFIFAAGPAVFQDGESEKPVEITIIGDATVEPHETFSLVVSSATTGFTGGESQATIVTDDVDVSISDASAIEGDSAAHYRGAFIQTTPGRNFNGLTFGPDGYLYTSEGPSPNAGSIDRYDGTTGAFVDEFIPAGRILGVRDKVFRAGFLYIGSESTDEVLRFDAATGAFDKAFVEANASILDGPHGVTFGPDANGDNVPELYVTGRNSQNLVRYDGATGQFQLAFSTTGAGALNLPEGLTIGPDGVVYVASSGSSQVQKYNPLTGAYLGTVTNPALAGPKDVKFGADGLMYVASSGNDRILRFTLAGMFHDDFVPAGAGGMDNTYRLAFGPDGDLYVAALGSAQILRFGTANEAVFTVSLSNERSVPVTVNYTTADETAIATDGDYTATSGTLTFAPGETTKTILVQTLTDAVFDPSETFTVTLSNPSAGATITDAQGVGTIVDANELVRVPTTTAGVQTTTSISTNTYPQEANQAVASDSAGNHVVVWASSGSSNPDGIFFQRYDSSGNPVGGETRVANVAGNVVVGKASSNGKFVVAWNANGGVYARLYNADGSPAGGEFVVISAVVSGNTTVENWVDSVAVDADGDFVVCFSQHRNGARNSYSINAQLYTAAGQLKTASVKVSTSNHINGGLACDANGNFVLVWNDGGVYAQRYNSSGKKVGGQLTVNSAGGMANVGMDADGDFVVVWELGSNHYAQVFNKDGTKRGSAVNFANATIGLPSSIVVEAGGDFVVTWTDSAPVTGRQVFARRYNLNGVAKEAAHQVSLSSQGGEQQRASVAVAGNGNYVVVWNMATGVVGSWPLTECEVFARRFIGSSSLTAAGGENTADASTDTLTNDQLQPIIAEAISRWQAAGITDSQVERLRGAQIHIGDLGGAFLGLATDSANTIWLDDNAAGWGWFVDPTPWDDSEFTTPGDQGEQNRMDLLTALEHELGHLLGFDHEEDGVMDDTLAAGTRATQRAIEDAAVVDWFVADEKSPLRRKVS